jgi:hypothetical protein
MSTIVNIGHGKTIKQRNPDTEPGFHMQTLQLHITRPGTIGWSDTDALPPEFLGLHRNTTAGAFRRSRRNKPILNSAFAIVHSPALPYATLR